MFSEIDKERRFYIKKFFRFLKENGIYAAYIKNVNNNVDGTSYFNYACQHNFLSFFKECPISQWINFSMVWANTPQGHEFWDKLNNSWEFTVDS